jgi:CspA family cold shock protein
MADTFNKKALQQKRAKKQMDKLERRADRKTNNDKGKSLEEMTAYLDEYGNITDVHPDKQKKRKVNDHDLLPGSPQINDDKVYEGMISLFFTDKGYGFITEDKTRETVFVHVNKLTEQIVEKDRVTYNKERTPKGFAAINVKKIK